MNALNRAGIDTPELRRAYVICRRIHARHDPATFPSVLYLPPAKRPHLHAIYAFARRTDDIADDHEARSRVANFHHWAQDTKTDLRTGTSTHPVRSALLHTLHTWGIHPSLVEELLDATEKDLEPTSFPTYADLARYLYGVNSTVCLMMLPILQPNQLDEDLKSQIADLGRAIQYADNLLDLPRDIRLGRLYLPMEDLREAGLTTADLRSEQIDPTALSTLTLRSVGRIRSLFSQGHRAITRLHPTSRPPIACAISILEGYLSHLERHPTSLLRRRIRLPPPVFSARTAAVWYARAVSARFHGSKHTVGSW
ncbi:phytoene/squalene synthase family protein [Streptomyces wuyuanensis]|uniref:phytoene/squalene synthase family protein n=1 Tax=Streptomyces wuyuanensis TaxID=1196353 RepID=UPI0034165528